MINKKIKQEKIKKIFICKYCYKIFTQFGHLKRHCNIHNKRNSYPCSKCNKIFTRKDSVLRHNRIHTGEKPYTCIICNKKFSRSDILKGHYVKCYNLTLYNSKYKCNICKKKFIYSKQLIKHKNNNINYLDMCLQKL